MPGLIVTSKTRAVTNRGPRWPYALDEDSQLAQGLILWYPAINQPLSGAAAVTAPAIKELSKTSNYNQAKRTETQYANPKGTSAYMESARGSAHAINSISGRVPSTSGTSPVTSGGTNAWRANTSAPVNPANSPSKAITALIWVRPEDWGATRAAVFATDSSYGAFNWGVSIEVSGGPAYIAWNGSWTVRSTDSRFGAVAGEWRRVGLIARSPDASTNDCNVLFDGLVAAASANTANSPNDIEQLDIGMSGIYRSQPIQWCNFAVWNRELTPGELRFDHSPQGRWSLFHELGRQRVFLPAVGGSTFNKTSTDAFALADTGAETATFPAVSTDSIVYADTSTEVAVFPETSAESFVVTDESVGQVGIFVTATDALVFADVSSETATFDAASSEALSFADTGSELATFVRALAEALVLDDTSSAVLEGIEKTATDALTLTDTASETATFARTVLEALTLTDSAAIATKVIGKLVVDALLLADTATAEGGAEEALTRGGSSLSRQQMRRLQRLQMIQRDDEEIINLIMGILK